MPVGIPTNSEVTQSLNLSEAAAGMRYVRAMRRLRAKPDTEGAGEA